VVVDGGVGLSFNPVMALLTQASLPLAGGAAAVLEFGNQTLTADDRTLEQVAERVRAAGRDGAAIDALVALGKKGRGDRTAEFYRAIGAASYQAIDVNDTYGSIVMDLNLDLVRHYDFRQIYDYVTNNGTGEHVFDQGAIFRNMHALTRVGGLMVHVMPFVNYINHGFYSFHPNLYHATAVANGYALLAIGVATRDGDGVLSHACEEADAVPNFLRRGARVPLGLIVSDVKLPSRRMSRRWADVVLAWRPNASAGSRMGLQMHKLLLRGRKLLSFAVMRKTADAEFRIPIQHRYVDDVAADLVR